MCSMINQRLPGGSAADRHWKASHKSVFLLIAAGICLDSQLKQRKTLESQHRWLPLGYAGPDTCSWEAQLRYYT